MLRTTTKPMTDGQAPFDAVSRRLVVLSEHFARYTKQATLDRTATLTALDAVLRRPVKSSSRVK
jgi:hypothetical protein